MGNNELTNFFNKGLLSEPGDTLTARITPSGRQVVKLHKSNGQKISATRYPTTGKIVQTISSNN